jgi:hypothetical protein
MINYLSGWKLLKIVLNMPIAGVFVAALAIKFIANLQYK